MATLTLDIDGAHRTVQATGKQEVPFAISRGLFAPHIVIREGDAGLSAYELAVNNGFEGTEAEWLASLQGGPAGWTPVLAFVADGERQHERQDQRHHEEGAVEQSGPPGTPVDLHGSCPRGSALQLDLGAGAQHHRE